MNTDISWIWNSPKLNALAEANFKRYVAILYQLFVEQKVKFDALIVGGNTGLIAGRIAQMVFDKTSSPRPPMISIPHQRERKKEPNTSAPERTNKVLALNVYNQSYDFKIPKITNLLFVDDEICKGTNALACLNAAIEAGACAEHVDYYIVAEDQNFIPSGYPKNVSIHFCPFAKGISGLNNTIVYITPHELEQPLKKIHAETKQILMILMGIPIRNKTIPQDNFDYLLNARAAVGIPELGELMTKMSKLLYKLIDDGINEYKSGSIDLKDFSYTSEILARTDNA